MDFHEIYLKLYAFETFETDLTHTKSQYSESLQDTEVFFHLGLMDIFKPNHYFWMHHVTDMTLNTSETKIIIRIDQMCTCPVEFYSAGVWQGTCTCV